MNRFMHSVGAACCCISLFFLNGCAGKSEDTAFATDPEVVVSCIGVMPVKPAVDYDNALSFSESKELKDGADALDAILRNNLHGKHDYRFASASFTGGLTGSAGASSDDELRQLGEQLSCNAMLEVIIERYSVRGGNKYMAEQPASAAFHYRLYELSKGENLCHGRFDETQQSLMENLYNWKKASGRGFVWVTAEKLLEDGVKERFAECPYLSN